jgi:hypothetical protein
MHKNNNKSMDKTKEREIVRRCKCSFKEYESERARRDEITFFSQ